MMYRIAMFPPSILQAIRSELLAYSGYPAISLFMPTSRNMPDNARDPIVLKNLITELTARLQSESNVREYGKALENLEAAVAEVNHDQNLEGLAIYANADTTQVVRTRFALPERVLIDEEFAFTPLLRAEYKAEPYYILNLALDEITLLEAYHERAREVREFGFPASNSSVGAGSKVPGGPGVNATAAVDDSRRRFFQKHLAELPDFSQSGYGVVLTGTPEAISVAKSLITPASSVLGVVDGNYIKSHPDEVAKLAIEVVREARRARAAELLDSVRVAQGVQRYESGPQSIAPLAKQGRVETLITSVEYIQPGRVMNTEGDLELLDSPTSAEDLDDVVEWLTHRVLESGGTVRLVDEDLMASSPVEALLRY